ncbi:MAG: UDP-N-acetylenolpyruvoylglucosamine reductase, partial [Actinobacteria bacterium]|nr:UDP-N-acetylenolpyruvoylglucosamine reductase [Actinomycetota bacterium]
QKSKEILLDATFQLKKNDPSILKERLKFAQNYRKLTQPSGKNTCGCFFQNVNGQSAGKLIDHSGLKGINIGKFFISEKHANFIINEGGGNPLDLMKLIKLIKTKVKEKFGVELKEEVVII